MCSSDLLYLRQRRVSAQYRHAIDHMTQGLCMWSPDGRLVLRNETYVKMYGLAPEIVRAGSSLRGLIDHRIKVGSFSGNPDQYVADLLSSIAKGKIINSVREHNGRYIAIVNHPMENGGWVATHEDVTARRQADLQRISMEGQIARRAMLEAAILAFRERIESVLKIVSDGAGKMQSAAVGLLGTAVQLGWTGVTALATAIAEIFTEVIIAPRFSDEALAIFGRKKNLRLMVVKGGIGADALQEIRSVVGGVLVQDRDRTLGDVGSFKVVTKRQPTPEEWSAMLFGWKVGKHVKSNSIVYCRGEQTLGVGAGQMARVDSSRIAVWKAGEAQLDLRGSVVASEALFPFADGQIGRAHV